MIVLGIIGLIADMTIPTLHQNIEIKTNVVRLQKVYSTFENAFRLAVSEDGSPENWSVASESDKVGQGSLDFFNKLSKNLVVARNCGIGAKCWSPKKHLNGRIDDFSDETKFNGVTAILADGTSFVLSLFTPDCNSVQSATKFLQNVCASIDVDINGDKKPNVVGRDVFTFWITKYGIIPFGTQGDSRFENDCKKHISGVGCTAWVLYNENMDYLYCPDKLSWEGKKSCKD